MRAHPPPSSTIGATTKSRSIRSSGLFFNHEHRRCAPPCFNCYRFLHHNLWALPPFERQESKMSFERLFAASPEGRWRQLRVGQKVPF